MGYNKSDLKDLVRNIFEIDAYQSKMGDDEDIVVVSFSVRESAAANDLVDFIEKGYDFVLDADATSGELETGDYKVFVEMERNRHSSKNIMEILDGVGKIAAIENFKFRYHKSFASVDVTDTALAETLPTNPADYVATISESKVDNYKEFFDKSYLESIKTIGDTLVVKKAYADPLGLKIKNFGPSESINETLEKINMNDYAEILFLTKYLGDYNVMKFGNKTLTLENKGHTLVVERI
jgi:hypothetical protein